MAQSNFRACASARIASLLFAAIFCLVAVHPASAERLESPLELMYAPGNTIVAGPLVEINPAGRIVLERKDVLGGKDRPPDKIDVRVPKEILGTLKIGDPYIAAYSLYRRDPRKAVGMALNPDGAVILASTGIEPALFRDTPAARAIVKAGRSEHSRESRRLVDLLLDALEGSDAQLQNLAAGEFAFEPETAERLRDADRARLEKVALDSKTPVLPRMSLLDASSRNPKEIGDWWKAAALQIVTTTPIDGYSDRATDPTSLVLMSFEVLDRYSVKVPVEALKRWVWSPTPPLVERVCVMLRREAPGEERSTIQLALADPKLPEATRKFLSDHLRRLDVIDERARKEGSG
ncbi:MAG: hypothetical protein ACREPX_12075 [Rhodanobacteraceae bacterium]